MPFRSWKLVSAGLSLLLLSVVSCKHDVAKTTTNPAAVQAVKAQFDDLRDSVDLKWNNMIASDDQKIGLGRLLIRELQQVPGQDPAKLQALLAANNRLKARRYDQLNMGAANRIDAYDAAQDSLLKALLPVAAPNGNAPTENARNFVEGIQQLDEGVVGFRVLYDREAQNYNNYLKLHRAELETLGGKYANVKPLPLFTIGAE